MIYTHLQISATKWGGLGLQVASQDFFVQTGGVVPPILYLESFCSWFLSNHHFHFVVVYVELVCCKKKVTCIAFCSCAPYAFRFVSTKTICTTPPPLSEPWLIYDVIPKQSRWRLEMIYDEWWLEWVYHFSSYVIPSKTNKKVTWNFSSWSDCPLPGVISTDQSSNGIVATSPIQLIPEFHGFLVWYCGIFMGYS